MGISAISAATNYINTRTVQKSTLHSNDGTEKIVSIPALWEKEYTKKDAVEMELCRRSTLSIDLVNNVVTGTILNPNMENLQRLEEELQTSGISKEVDWVRMESTFKKIGFDTSAAAYTIGEDDFTNRADYLASRYVAAEDKIKNSTAGDTQAEQLRKLDEVYRNALNRLAESYSSLVGSYLEQNSVSGEKEKTYNSVVSGVESKVEEYRSVLSGNAALESLKGTQDEWVLDDDAYVASVLRTSAGGVTETSRTKSVDAPYTMEDLEILGQYVSALSKMDGPNAHDDVLGTFERDESRLGVEYALLDMKTDRLRNSGRVSDAMSELLQKTMNGFIRFYLERTDEKLSENRARGGVLDDTKGFAALDRSTVWDVYQYTIQEYRNSGDMIKALLSGVKYGSKKQRNC